MRPRYHPTGAQVVRLRELVAAGATATSIASELGLARSTVRDLCARIGLEPHRAFERRARQSDYVPRTPLQITTVRRCLCCGREFRSEGPHNRLCSQCRTKPDPGQWRYDA